MKLLTWMHWLPGLNWGNGNFGGSGVEPQYDAEIDWKWVCGLFLVGTIVTGWLVHTYLVNPDWHKAIRFIVTTVPAVAIGVVLVKLRYYIQIIIALIALLIGVGIVISIVTSLV